MKLKQILIWLCVTVVLLPTMSAHAVEGGSGVYSLGLVGPQAGIAPDPGAYFTYNFYYYKGDSTTRTSSSSLVQVPGTGLELPVQVNGSVQTEVEACAHIFTFTYMFDAKVLGARPGVSVWVPYVTSDLSLAGNGVMSLTGPWGNTWDFPLSGSAEPSSSGLGDITLTGKLGWQEGVMHYLATLNIYAPTGKYDKNSVVNAGRNHWAVDPMMCVTYLNEKIGLEVSGAAGLTFNFENSDTDYDSGEEFHLDLAVIQHFSEQFHLGLVGYLYKQLSSDSGPGAVDGYKGRVYACGPEIGGMIPLSDKNNLFLKARWYKEFSAKNRMEGDTVFLSASVNF